MKIIRFFFTCVAVLSIGLSYSQPASQKGIGNQLDQWNDGPAKAAILSIVDAVTDPANPAFLPADDCVAVFDMALWSAGTVV